MAAKTETRVIKIDVSATEAAKATKRLNAHMKRLNRSARSVTESIFRFQMGMQALASFLAIREIADLADKYTILQGRLKLVIKSQEDLAAVQRDLNNLASDVFTDVSSVAKAYTDLQLKVKGVRLTHQDTIKVVRTMAQSFRISGATAKEASSATLQLMQGLSSGKLQGDELKTLRESNILLLDAILEQYRKVNKLQKDAKLNIKDLGAEGKLTPEIILEALKNAAPKFEAQAKKLSLTFENIFVVASNKLAAFLGQVEAKGQLKPLKDGLLGLAKAADSAAVAFGSFVALFTAATVISGIKSTVKALMSLRAALSIPMLAGLTVVLGSLVGLIYELGKSTTKVNGVAYKSLDLWMSMSTVLMGDISKSLQKISDDFNKLVKAIEPILNIINWVLSLPKRLVTAAFDILSWGTRLVTAWVRTLGKIKDITIAFGMEILDGIIENAAKKYESGESKGFGRLFGYLASQLVETKENIKKSLNEEQKKGLPKTFEELSGTFAQDMKDIWVDDLFKGIFELFGEKVGGAAKETEKEIATKFKSVLERAAAITKPFVQEMKDIETKSSQHVKAEVKNLGTFVRDGLNKYINDIKDWGKQVTDMANRTMKSFEDAIVKAVTTGKLQFKDLADSILQDIARIMVRQHISGPLAQALASAFAPTATVSKTPVVYGTGPYTSLEQALAAQTPATPTIPTIPVMPPVYGPINNPQMAAPRIAPSQSKTTVNVQNFTGQQSAVSETIAPDGTKNVKITIGNIVKDGLASGQYDRVLQGAFNIKRVGSR